MKTNTSFVWGEGGGNDFGGMRRIDMKTTLPCMRSKEEYRINEIKILK